MTRSRGYGPTGRGPGWSYCLMGTRLNRQKELGKTEPTERINPTFRTIDGSSCLKIPEIIDREDPKVAWAVRSQLQPIALAIEMAERALKQGGAGYFILAREVAGDWGCWMPLNVLPPSAYLSGKFKGSWLEGRRLYGGRSRGPRMIPRRVHRG
jgi:hypothetical protein